MNINTDHEYLGHICKIINKRTYYTVFLCLRCGYKFTLYPKNTVYNYRMEDEYLIYLDGTYGPLKLTCDEMIIKNILE